MEHIANSVFGYYRLSPFSFNLDWSSCRIHSSLVAQRKRIREEEERRRKERLRDEQEKKEEERLKREEEERRRRKEMEVEKSCSLAIKLSFLWKETMAIKIQWNKTIFGWVNIGVSSILHTGVVFGKFSKTPLHPQLEEERRRRKAAERRDVAHASPVTYNKADDTDRLRHTQKFKVGTLGRFC